MHNSPRGVLIGALVEERAEGEAPHATHAVDADIDDAPRRGRRGRSARIGLAGTISTRMSEFIKPGHKKVHFTLEVKLEAALPPMRECEVGSAAGSQYFGQGGTRRMHRAIEKTHSVEKFYFSAIDLECALCGYLEGFKYTTQVKGCV